MAVIEMNCVIACVVTWYCPVNDISCPSHIAHVFKIVDPLGYPSLSLASFWSIRVFIYILGYMCAAELSRLDAWITTPCSRMGARAAPCRSSLSYELQNADDTDSVLTVVVECTTRHSNSQPKRLDQRTARGSMVTVWSVVRKRFFFIHLFTSNSLKDYGNCWVKNLTRPFPTGQTIKILLFELQKNSSLLSFSWLGYQGSADTEVC